MEYRLEFVPIPVSDVDRAKAFYAEKVGYDVDLDVSAETDNRVSDERCVVQLTPPGSACSIAFSGSGSWTRSPAPSRPYTLGRFGHRGGACGAR
jgi:catechol 2,3-dioxygenase-like lactoylglutathione lyase family enzyme